MMQSELISRPLQERITAMSLVERTRSQAARESLAKELYDPAIVVRENEIIERIAETPFRVIGQKLVKGESLTFDEAFIGMTFVVAATNRALFRKFQPTLQKAHGLLHIEQSELRGPGQTFLTAMAQRESSSVLRPEEIAGMVASGMMDINYRFQFNPYILETGGMGGDKGFIVNGEKKKVINASTLSSIVLASLGIPVIKHGSYANTSAVGSTEAIEARGVNIYQDSFEEIKRLFDATGFYFSDAHVAKTIHDLSHSPFMRHETINHIVGPMTPPVDKKTVLHKVIGVNEGVHPSLVAKAYEILHERGYQNVGNVIAVCGLGQSFLQDKVPNLENKREIRNYAILDEVSPFATLLAVVRNGKYEGCFVVTPQDFGVKIDPNKIQVVNTELELLAANGSALQGLGGANSDYLAMNAAVGLFAAEYLGRDDAIVNGELNKEYLRESFKRCREAIISGQAARHLERIVRISNGESRRVHERSSLFEDVDVVVFDIDNTLVRPHDPDFYLQYSQAVDRSVARVLDVSLEKGREVANFYREHLGGGERALFDGNIHTYFPEFPPGVPDYALLYEEMCTIDPSGQFDLHERTAIFLKALRAKGKKIVALTDSPEDLSRRILSEAGLNPDVYFDLYLAYRPEHGPQKKLQPKEVFGGIANYFDVDPEKILAVGDTFLTDIKPAQDLGMKTCLISENQVGEHSGVQVRSIGELIQDKGLI